MAIASRTAAGPSAGRLAATTAAVAGGLFWQEPAAAQGAPPQNNDRVATVSSTGSLSSFTSANPGRLHFSLGLGVDSADYFRGGFDDVKEDLDAFSYRAGVAATVEVVDGQYTDIDLTVGSANGFSNEAFVGSPLEEDHGWYESNNYIGLTARFDDGWVAGVTYTNYAVPIDDFENSNEIALAALYGGDNAVGWLNPQLKFATRFDEPEGWYAEAGIAPALDLGWPGDGSASLSFPVTVGYGWNDYYGSGSDDTGYVSGGIHGSLPLAFVPHSYGSWSVSAGVDVIYRPGDLRNTQPSFADDPVVAIGTTRLTLHY